MNLKHEIRPLILIAVVVFAVFANSLGGEFVYDDQRQILRNPLIQDPALYTKALTSDVWAFKGDGSVAASNYYRPVFVGWMILNFLFFGTSPFGWHFLNLLIHIAVTLLAFGIARRFGISRAAAFVVALVFGVHPVHTESVAWVSGAPDPLFSLFILLAVWFCENDAAAARRGDRRALISMNLGLALVFYALALGVKEIATLCFPIFAMLYARSGDDGTVIGEWTKAWTRSIPFAALAVMFFVFRLIAIGAVTQPIDGGSASFTESLLSAPAIFVFYLGQVFAPSGLGPNYPLRIVTEPGLVSFILPLAVSIFGLFVLTSLGLRRSFGLLALGFFLLPLAPAMYAGSFPFEQIVHDRYLYFPLLGMLLLVVPVLEEVLTRFSPESGGRILVALSLVAGIALSVQTIGYNSAWRTSVALWERAVEVDPTSAFNWSQYAGSLSESQRIQESIAAFNKSIDIRPTPLAYYGKARNLTAIGKLDEAVFDLQTVVEMPNEKLNAYTLYQTYELLALVLSKQDNHIGAERYLREARKRLPIYAAALTDKMAVILYQTDRKDEALQELESARGQAISELLPESKTVYLRLASLYAEKGRTDDARTALRQYLVLTAKLKDNVTMADREQALRLLQSLR